jgi:hypothetical protein
MWTVRWSVKEAREKAEEKRAEEEGRIRRIRWLSWHGSLQARLSQARLH